MPSVDSAPQDRRSRILQAAEQIFAQEGYHATTMRNIADAAGVKISLVTYHFETKLNLYAEIFRRRQYLNERRQDLLRQIDLDAPEAVRRVVEAFTDPILELHDRPDDVWFARLVLREASDPSSMDRSIIADLFDPMAREFIAAIAVANPGHDGDFYRWAYLFAVGALTSSSYETRADNLGDGASDTTTRGSRKARHLRDFIVAGWSAKPPRRGKDLRRA